MLIGVFRANPNLFPEVNDQIVMISFFSKYYTFAMSFLFEYISPIMHSVGTQAVCNGNTIGATISNSKDSPCASRSLAKTGLLAATQGQITCLWFARGKSLFWFAQRTKIFVGELSRQKDTCLGGYTTPSMGNKAVYVGVTKETSHCSFGSYGRRVFS